MWHRQHYNAIAKDIRTTRATMGDSPALVDLMLRLATRFKNDNPNFDGNNFIESCGGVKYDESNQ